MKTLFSKVLPCLAFGVLPLVATAQVNSGSNGSDGAFNPTSNTTIIMADHPNGIYHYTSVNIPSGVTVTFTPNANNSPVVWLVQGNCVITGGVDVSGQAPSDSQGASGGAGGFRGGNSGSAATAGQGPGGGHGGNMPCGFNNASFGTLGGSPDPIGCPPPSEYGNNYLIPFLGGSGGGGIVAGSFLRGAGGGGGAIMIAANTQITLNGGIFANGGGVGEGRIPTSLLFAACFSRKFLPGPGDSKVPAKSSPTANFQTPSSRTNGRSSHLLSLEFQTSIAPISSLIR